MDVEYTYISRRAKLMRLVKLRCMMMGLEKFWKPLKET